VTGSVRKEAQECRAIGDVKRDGVGRKVTR
jgi:hypothetical protein